MRARSQSIFLVLALASASAALAQSGGVYSLRWSNFGAGQTFGNGGAYRLGSTIGQPDAGMISGGSYQLSGGFWAASGSPTVDAPPLDPVPGRFAAREPAPNPFSIHTALGFDLPAAKHVRLVVHGVDGRVVRWLVDEAHEAGRHRAIWDGRDDRGHPVPSGVYFVRLIAGEFKSTRRIVKFQ